MSRWSGFQKRLSQVRGQAWEPGSFDPNASLLTIGKSTIGVTSTTLEVRHETTFRGRVRRLQIVHISRLEVQELGGSGPRRWGIRAILLDGSRLLIAHGLDVSTANASAARLASTTGLRTHIPGGVVPPTPRNLPPPRAQDGTPTGPEMSVDEWRKQPPIGQ